MGEMPVPHKQALNAARQSKKQERLEARVTRAQKLMIERAARIRGTSVTNFVLASAQEAAAETIKDFEVLTLRDKARETFVDTLIHPPTPNAAARAAAKRYLNRVEA
jgi:uncharacterized protein (DUF1778 family)